ncbi:MAG: ACP S-malonyltransferase, partial [Thermodesulfobacteriota bacterium]
VSDENGLVSPANFNSPVQVVISGNKDYVEKASNIAKEEGAKRVVPLDVSAPFHCALMHTAANRLKEVLDTVEFSEINYPIVTNVEAKPNVDASTVNDLLVKQMTSPVRWTDTINYLNRMGVDHFLEIGPSNVLCGLIKRTIKDINSSNIEKVEQLNHIKENGI